MASASKIREKYRRSLRERQFRSESTTRLAEPLVEAYVQLQLREAYLAYLNSAKENSENQTPLEEWIENLIHTDSPLLSDIVESAMQKALTETVKIGKEDRQAVLADARSMRVNVGREFEIREVTSFWLMNSATSILAGVFTGFLVAILLGIPSLSVEFQSLADHPPLFGTIMIVCLVSLWLYWGRRGGD